MLYLHNLHYEKFSDGTIECIEKEIPYALPKNWKWCRLYQLTEAIPDAMADGPFGSNLKKEHYTNNQEVRIIQLSNIGENGWENHNKKYTTYSHASTLARSCVQQGTIVIAKMMPAGRAIIVPNIENNYILSSDVIKFVPHKKLNKEYLICALNSTTFLSQVAFGAHGVTRIRTSLSKLKEYLVPIPPLPEQNRIVSLFKSANSNIGTIINEKEALLDLLKITKSKILDLAIRGKLVPQDPNDEPASVLLERIRKEKDELIKAGKLKRDKQESVIFRGEDNSYYETTTNDTTNISISKKFPFEIPDNWAWTRFRNIIIDDKGGGTPDKSNPKYWGGNIPWMSVKDFSGAKNGVIMDTIDHVTQEGVNNSSTNIIDTSAIILCTRMGLGKYAKLAHPTAINQDLRAIWLSSHICENYFLSFYKTLNIDGNGTTVEGIKRDELMGNMIPIPPKSEQKRIADKVLQLFSTLDSIIHDC